MVEYEIFYLVGESRKADLENIKKGVEEAIVSLGGEVQEGEFVDERRMEYPIRGERRGTYVAKRFTAKDGVEDISGALTKKFSFDKNMLRFIIVRAEGLPTLSESQERVRRLPDMRRRVQGRYQLNRPRSFQPISAAPKETPAKPALSDMEIDKKLGELLDA